MIDFKRNIIRFKEDREKTSFEDGKDIKFSDVIDVKKLELDVIKGEHKTGDKNELKYKYKFSVKTLVKEVILFARSIDEREIWMDSFSKIIDMNKNEALNFNLGVRADSCLQMMDSKTLLD